MEIQAKTTCAHEVDAEGKLHFLAPPQSDRFHYRLGRVGIRIADELPLVKSPLVQWVRPPATEPY